MEARFNADEHYAAESSRTTHAALECIDARRLFARMFVRSLRGAPNESALLSDSATFEGAPAIVSLVRGEFVEMQETEIRGSGYVVESLQVALWCFEWTHSFEETLLRAANLGEDPDTTAAVCGQIAGAYYGHVAIPENWLFRIAMRSEISSLAHRLNWSGKDVRE